jgi:uroporphyrin-3 C-methyltransferase
MSNSSQKSVQVGAVPVMPIAFAAVIFIVLGASFFLLSKQKSEMELMHTYIAKVETELGQKNDIVKQFKNDLTKISADSATQDQVMSDSMRTLQDHLDKVEGNVKALANSTDEDWVLAQVEYLIRMAGLRIGMKEDVKGAVAMLDNAQILIEKMGDKDEGLKQVRLAITKDMKSMEVYREVDIPGTYSALVALGESIEKLPLIPLPAAKSIDGSQSGDAQPTMLSEINEKMAGYLTIRKHSKDELKMLLSPEDRINFRDSIRLSLEQAQTALMRGDQVIYDASLVKVRKWVLDSFVADNFKVQMATKKIDELSKVQVKRDLPSVADSEQELKRFITDRMLGDEGSL